MLVNEIFFSIDGEGKRAGELAAFIRLTGCNLRCSYCDTEYAFHEGKIMTVEKIADAVKNYFNITLTGGEPLCQNCHELIKILSDHEINIETNGSIDISEYRNYPQVFFTIDYKCPSSDMQNKMFEKNFELLNGADVLKFVVGDLNDLNTAKNFCDFYKPKSLIYISPVFGKINPAEIVEYMKKNLCGWRLQLQLHKYIWNPEKRGV